VFDHIKKEEEARSGGAGHAGVQTRLHRALSRNRARKVQAAANDAAADAEPTGTELGTDGRCRRIPVRPSECAAIHSAQPRTTPGCDSAPRRAGPRNGNVDRSSIRWMRVDRHGRTRETTETHERVGGPRRTRENGTASAPGATGADLEERLVAEGEIAGGLSRRGCWTCWTFDGDIDLGDVEGDRRWSASTAATS